MFIKSDSKWNSIDNKIKEKIKYDMSKKSGDFFISLEDFATYFRYMTICSLDSDYSTNNLGKLTLLKGIWIGGLTAGGSRNDLNEFSKNPQFLLKISTVILIEYI